MTKIALILALATAVAAPAGALPDTPLTSGNVTVVGNIPELGAVGGHVRAVNTLLGPKSYFMMSGASGVSAYDITVPEAPVLAGRLALPHWSNEDVEVGGDLMLVATDPQWVDWVTPPGTIGGMYILDVSKLPAISFAYTNPLTGNRWIPPVTGEAGHTITCVRADCSYAMLNGTSEITVVDLRVPSDPKIVTRFYSSAGSSHDAQVDATGLVWISGSGGVAIYDFSVPASPVEIDAFSGGLSYQHNSWRPRSAEWVPRTAGNFAAPDVRPGESVLVTEEEFYPVLQQTQCLGQGRFQTRRVRDTDSLSSGATPVVDVLDTWATELQLGSVSTASVCSAHYFHERNNIVAIAWYQQGVRFLDVSNPRDIRQIGYFMPAHATAVFSVEWIGEGTLGGEIAYTLDPARGLDILRFDRAPNAATVVAPIPPGVTSAKAPTAIGPHPKWGYACSLLAV